MIVLNNSSFSNCHSDLDVRSSVTCLNSIPHGRLADRLLSEGLLTPKLLEDLKKEWQYEDAEKKSGQSSSNVLASTDVKRSRREALKFKRSSRKYKT